MNNSNTAIDGTATRQSNSLRHTIATRTIDGNRMDISIRLNDECKNGHQDFAITADIYEGKRWVAGGCCHEEILKAHPELKIFIDLHLCDYSGAPMYAAGNGFYHLKRMSKEEFIQYFNCNIAQYDILAQAEDEQYFTYLLQTSDILQDWQNMANKAIKQLEQWTGLTLLNDSKRSQFVPLTKEVFEQVETNIKDGYYSTVNISERKQADIDKAKAKVIEAITADRDKGIKKATDEYNVKMEILKCGLPIDNFIYYNHSNTGVFNWKSFDNLITQNQFDTFLNQYDKSTLPVGITFKLSSGE